MNKRIAMSAALFAALDDSFGPAEDADSKWHYTDGTAYAVYNITVEGEAAEATDGETTTD